MTQDTADVKSNYHYPVPNYNSSSKLILTLILALTLILTHTFNLLLIPKDFLKCDLLTVAPVMHINFPWYCHIYNIACILEATVELSAVIFSMQFIVISLQ